MKWQWFLLGILGVLLGGLPANAGKLVFWDFQSQGNRLEFTTDEGVKPEIKLVENPTRLVIELPGTILDRTTVKEKYLGTVRGFRVGQSSQDTVSLVLELAPGYTVDLDQVELRSIANKRWTVELPNPKINNATTANRPISPPSTNERPLPPLIREPLTKPISPLDNPATSEPQLENNSQNSNQTSSSPYVKATRNGFFIDIKGDRSNQVKTRQDGNKIIFDLQDVTLPDELVSQSVIPNQYGIEEINFAQTSSSTAQITLKLGSNSPNWLATFSRVGGLILVPRGELPNRNKPEEPIAKNPSTNTNNSNPSTITAIAVAHDNSRLIIRSDRGITPQTTFLRNGIYEVTVPNAQLIEPFPNPKLKAGSPISQLRVRQEGSNVVFVVTTRLGVRLGNAVQQSSSLIAFPISIPTRTVSDRTRERLAQQPLNSPRNSRPLVVIDPGHGGKDPGTIGIGGVQEKNVILPISLDVAAELKKQGIEVRLTRDQDYFVSLQGRTDFANKINADLFVSIHANAINLSRPDVNGLETYYYQNGRRLSEIIHWNILNSVNIRNRNVRRARFYVLRHSKMPATLVEVGFLTGAEDSARLKDPNHRQKIAVAIAQGIIQYIKEKKI